MSGYCSLISAVFLLFFTICQKNPVNQPVVCDDKDAVVILKVQGSDTYYDAVSGATISSETKCLIVTASIFGSPWPKITSISVNDTPFYLDMHWRGLSTVEGIDVIGYLLTDSIHGPKTISIETEAGWATGTITIPRTGILITEPAADFNYGSDVTLSWTGDAEHYAVTCYLQSKTDKNFDYIDTLTDNNSVTIPAARIPDFTYGFNVVVIGYSGNFPMPGITPNMTGTIPGFLSAENIEPDNWDRVERFVLH